MGGSLRPCFTLFIDIQDLCELMIRVNQGINWCKVSVVGINGKLNELSKCMRCGLDVRRTDKCDSLSISAGERLVVPGIQFTLLCSFLWCLSVFSAL